jgi:hypothetical protein
LRIRIRPIQAVVAAPNWLSCSSSSDPETKGDHGFAEDIAMRAMLMDATENKISTFNLNLKW